MFNFLIKLNFKIMGAVPPALADIFPHADDVVIKSVEFDDMLSAVTSCTTMLSDVIAAVNHTANEDKFRLVSEVNPNISGLSTISKEWAPDEIAKLWVIKTSIDMSTVKTINAYGKAQVFGTVDEAHQIES